MSKVFIGVGHGGTDPGACANDFKEKDLNLSIATYCRDALMANGIEVEMSRTTDVSDTLNGKVARCNAYNPDVAIDIHHNAGGGNGFEAYYHYKGGNGLVLAGKIEDEVLEIGQNSRGLKTKLNSSGTDYFGFIRTTNMPAVIVECAFMDTLSDIEIVSTEEKRKVFAIAIAKGVLNYFGKTYAEESANSSENSTSSSSTTSDDALYKVQVGAYSVKENAEKVLEQLESEGYDVYLKTE